MQNTDPNMHNKPLLKKTKKSLIQRLRAGPSLLGIFTGLLFASAIAHADIIFQADFNGTNGGTGGTNDMVTVGGTGAIIADGTNVSSFVTSTNPFAPGAGNYLEVQKLTTSGGGLYSPVLFTFASDSNSWDGWQGPNVLDTTNGSGECIGLHAAQDVFFRVNTNYDSPNVGGVNNLFCIRTIEQYSWSDGGNGLKLVLNGQNNGSMVFQIQNAGNNGGIVPDALVNVTTSGGNIDPEPLYDVINMNFTDHGNLFTNGYVYHVAFSLNTDTNGLTTVSVYVKQGTGAIDTVADLQGWASFNIVATNIVDYNGNLTQICFTNQPWNFGVGWANDGQPFVCDYAAVRSYNSVPSTFAALPGTGPILLPPVVSDGQITLSWTGEAQLQWAPSVQGPWTSIDPEPASPYSEPLASGSRFYRLLIQ
jgi:hypothetical protein